MKTLFLCIAFALLSTFSFCSESLPMSETDIADRGLVPCLREFCNGFDLGTVPTKEAIERIQDKDIRDTRSHELQKVRIAVSTLCLLAEHLQASDLLIGDRCEIFRQLARLLNKGSSAQPIGVGNMEFSAMVSILMSGVFFQVYADVDEVTRRDLLSSFRSHSALESAEAYRFALALEGCQLPEQPTTVAESSQQLAIQEGFPDAIKDTKVAVLDVLAKGLQHRAKTGNIEHLLTDLDKQWLAWDLLWASRLKTLCLLSQDLPEDQARSTEAAADDFRAFEMAIAALSAVDRASLNAKFASSESDMKRVAHTILEVQEHLSNKGCHVLTMVAHRLQTQSPE